MNERNCANCKYRRICGVYRHFFVDGDEVIRRVVDSPDRYAVAVSNMRGAVASQCQYFEETDDA